MKKRPIHTLVTHQGGHFDEMVAIYLLKKEGENLYPGVSKAKIVYCTNGGFLPEDKTEEQLEKEGILYIGVGKGRFDDHTLDGKLKEDECCATLVAKHLGIEDDPIYEKLLDFALRNDRKGAGHTFDLAHLIKFAYKQYQDDPEKIYKWVATGLNFYFVDQINYHSITKREYDDLLQSGKIKIEKVKGPNNNEVKIAIIESENDQIAKLARSRHGCEAAIVIQIHKTGNVQIFSKMRVIKSNTMDDIAQMIRLAEQKAEGKIINADWKKLAGEGQIDGCTNWYYHRSCGMLLNGSLSHPDVPPTKIPIKDIVRIVKIGLDPNYYEPKRTILCQKGICTSSQKDPCSFYPAGLLRCRTIRYKQKNEKTKSK